MSKVAFLGLGAMGSRMAGNLLKANHDVTVWNLTQGPMEPLVAQGAKPATSPREAAVGNEFVISMVTNDEASRHIWLDASTGALVGMAKGAIAVESSTLTPAWVRELADTMDKAGVHLLDAMVSGSTPQAAAGTLVFLAGGDAPSVERAKPLLDAMGSTVQHAGPVGCGALAKLATNALMGVQMTTLAELIGMLRRQGADPKPVLDAVSATAMWNPHLTRDLDSMLAHRFQPEFPVRLLEKDLSYTLKSGGDAAFMPTIRVVRDVFQAAIAKELGNLNMTAVVQLFDRLA